MSPDRLTHIEHVFDGGWAPDYGALAAVSIEKDGRCKIPWLMTANNVEYEADGTPHKIGGLVRLYAIALEQDPLASYFPSVRGLYDFWTQGVTGSPLQYRVLHVGTKIKIDRADADFTDIFTGLLDNSIPHYSSFEGTLIIAQTGPDTPKMTDGITHSEMPTGTPNFSFSEPHKLRMWVAGVDAAPSTLFYSAQEDPTDWTSGGITGAGDIAISPGDGDRITAIASHRNELFVFKGPHRGSIHRITGSSPSGDDTFGRNDFIPTGLGAIGQRSIFRFGNDLGFMWSDGTVHSLNTTERYGDFLETSLSRPLNSWLHDNVSSGYLEWASAVTFDPRGVVRICLPINASTKNNMLISMDFRFDPPRWSRSSVLGDSCECLAVVSDPTASNRPVVMSGGLLGWVRKLDYRTPMVLVVGTTIPLTVETPFLSYTQPARTSTIYYGGVRLTPKTGLTGTTLSWVRDGHPEQTQDVVQWTGDVLAEPSGSVVAGATPFTLGTSALAGERAITSFLDLVEGGEFQQIQYKITDTTVSGDCHPKSILASIKPGAISMETTT